MLQKIKSWARKIKRYAVTLWFAYRHPATPRLPKALCWFVVAYALSPIDLIPDFIPVLGFLDDALLLPGLIWLALHWLPAPVVAQSRVKAEAWLAEKRAKPSSRAGLWLIVGAWLACAAGLAYWVSNR